MNPIYKPRGAAKEYGEYALNIYTGCPHRCFYCFAPRVLHKSKEDFHSCVEPRKNIVEATRRQLERENITGKLIHLCFTCDPYPKGYDSRVTREIIKLLKEHGNHIQILTKGSGRRDMDLLDNQDWYGVTIDGSEKNPKLLIRDLVLAKNSEIKTWVSFEPVLNEVEVITLIDKYHCYFDKVKIGKLNYHASDINWKAFGNLAERVCQENNVDYYIKDSLRAEMEETNESV